MHHLLRILMELLNHLLSQLMRGNGMKAVKKSKLKKLKPQKLTSGASPMAI